MLPIIEDYSQVECYRFFCPDADSLRMETVEHGGFSGASLERLLFYKNETLLDSLLAKRVDLNADWFSINTSDRVGREAALIRDEYEQLIKCINLPYLALSFETDAYVLIMRDVSDYLFADSREPVNDQSEQTLIAGMSAMHAQYWQSADILTKDYLLSAAQLMELLAPNALPAKPVLDIQSWMMEGWSAAEDYLSQEQWQFMQSTGSALCQRFDQLPCTLVHGDAKIANSYIVDNRAGFFDWGFAAAAPATVDLGWYLAVNASRLTQPKESFVEAYRQALLALSVEIDNSAWQQMLDFGYLTAMRMLLWTKARNKKRQVNGSEAEWSWWIQHLQRIVENY